MRGQNWRPAGVQVGGSTTLGHYEITQKLGEGGVTVVYCAIEMKLNRDVAIKVLPKQLASAPERMERFHREARVLAQLNHPGIAGILGGKESNGEYALVMELAEGQTLADRLAAAPMSVEEALGKSTRAGGLRGGGQMYTDGEPGSQDGNSG